MGHLLAILLTNLYWLSWVGIGASASVLLADIFRFRLKQLPNTFFVPVSLMAGFGVWLAMSIVFYVFQASSIVATFGYILLLCLAVGYGVYLYHKGRVDIRSIIPKSKLTIVLIGVLAIDFILTTYLGSALQNGGDAYIHIGRIHDMSIEGYTLATPYSQFAIDANYHFNLVYSLYQPLLSLSHESALDAWRFSSAFFRFVNWLCIFAAAAVVVRYIPRTRFLVRHFAPLVTICCIGAFGYVFMYSVYPSQVAIVWLYMLVFSMIYSVRHRKEGAVGVITSSALLTFTHPSYALMGAAIIATALVVAIIIHERLRKAYMLTLLGSLAVTLLGPFIAYVLSGPLTSAQSDIAQGVYQSLGPLTLRRFDLLLPDSLVSTLFSIGSITGTVMLLVWCWKKSRAVFAVFAPVLLLWFIIMYIPGPLNILLLKLPPWLIARFDALNIFQYVTPFIGFWWLATKVPRVAWRVPVGVSLCVVLSGFGFMNHLEVYKDMKTTNIENYANARMLNVLLPDDERERLDILAVSDIGYQTMAVRRVNLLDAGEGHTVPKAHPAERHACAESIFNAQSNSRAVIGARYLLWDEVTIPPVGLITETKNARRVGQFWLADIKPQATRTTQACAQLKGGVFVGN